MKIVELRAEKARTISLLKNKQFCAHVGDIGMNFSVPMKVSDKAVEKKATQIRQDYNEAIQLLKKLDAINNALYESDAKTYIEVAGNHLSVATARQYLDEMNDTRDDDMDNDALRLDSDNCRYDILDDCSSVAYEYAGNNFVDPLNLKDRKAEFDQKKLDWYYGLKTAVSIIDAITDAPFFE